MADMKYGGINTGKLTGYITLQYERFMSEALR